MPSRRRWRLSENSCSITPKLFASFFQSASALYCPSVLDGKSAYTAPADACKVKGCENSNGLRVTISTEPATPPSTNEALELFCTTTELTISDGSSV